MTCKFCGQEVLISKNLSACVDCLREMSPAVRKKIEQVHDLSRRQFNLPVNPPKSETGMSCNICQNNCKIAVGERGFCGLVENINGSLVRHAGNAEKGLLSYYLDPNPTNCCASWVCPAGTGCGYPKFANKSGPEHGFFNLAVFYGACNFNCLFCQNWHFREMSVKARSNMISPKNLVKEINENVSCICYFGGDPSPQMVHSLKTSEIAFEIARKKNQILRICWETNGGMNWSLMERARDLALKSGGCIKIDLKCFDENLHRALCGVSNSNTLKNFKKLAASFSERPEIPLLIGTTLLIPGYVDEEEVRKIAHFISSLDPRIPYSLLGFYPHFFMRDLPRTSKKHAKRCLKAAQDEGLENVNIGNIHLLSNIEY
ncbi:MAG: radical SAM protein [Candidatus Helarchaeales archaeon]